MPRVKKKICKFGKNKYQSTFFYFSCIFIFRIHIYQDGSRIVCHLHLYLLLLVITYHRYSFGFIDIRSTIFSSICSLLFLHFPLHSHFFLPDNNGPLHAWVAVADVLRHLGARRAPALAERALDPRARRWRRRCIGTNRSSTTAEVTRDFSQLPVLLWMAVGLVYGHVVRKLRLI
ncbi:hypothetical protein PFISCL1PPCAC_4423 [Pristionchus fissidentatus]|uniref:G protein-coupled receptor n=1 Tax=Pristionchus fissidentatus TaxID=1538716 RepID=A0AAV5V0S6_9BILA|nr:hypothetical protein PFISCL1PPCAC_4423 [Pristionchus fissidentatus]